MERANRKSSRTKLTKLINAAKELLNGEINEDKTELIVLRDRIKGANENLQFANEKLTPLLKEDEYEKESESVVEYEDQVTEIISRLQLKIEERTYENLSVGSSCRGSTVAFPIINETNGNAMKTNENDNVTMRTTNENNVRLPKLELRKFNGDLSDWSLFWEQFRTSIHENDKLDANAKFNYLSLSLIGKAAETISGLTASERSYNDAIEMLKHEYGNHQRIIDSYVQKLLTITPVKNKLDNNALRNLYNITSSIIRNLKSLGVKTSEYAMMVKSVMLNAMPYSMKIDFYKKHPINTKVDIAIQIDNLLKYLQLEVESIELAQPTSINVNSVPLKKFEKQNREKTKDIKRGEFTAAGLLATVGNCLFCKSSQHGTDKCKAENSIDKKKEILKENRRCYRCTKPGHSSKFCRVKIVCDQCKLRHASSMCDPKYKRTDQGNTITSLFAKNGNNIEKVYLQTAKTYVYGKNAHPLFVRLILDGGSQLTFIKESISHKLDLKVIGQTKLTIMPFGSTTKTNSKLYKKVEFSIVSQYNDNKIRLIGIEVPDICYDYFQEPILNHPFIKTLEMADIAIGNVPIESGVSILIGADNYWKLVTGEFIKLSEHLSVVNTKIGWTLHGANINDNNIDIINSNVVVSLNTLVVDENNLSNDDLKRFWDLDTIGINDTQSSYLFTDKFINENIKKVNGRYEVRIPWKNDCVLDDNFNSALVRMKNLTLKLRKNSKLKAYDLAIQEMLNNDIAEKVIEDCKMTKKYYMPHHPVYRDDKTTTKLRVVFDASAHAPNLQSLNDLLHKGENLVQDLMKILLNFRVGSIGIIADIEKAFLQIELNEKDRDSHRFLWYDSMISNEYDLPPIQTYRMTRVTFGVTCSPFLLSATLKRLFKDEKDKFPSTIEKLETSFYVDDFVSTADKFENAIKIYNESKFILKQGGMNLRKWYTNDQQLLNYIKSKEIIDENLTCTKILGLIWNIETDILQLDMSSIISFSEKHEICTKRIILQAIGRIFDPLGIICPFTIKAKILMQNLWKEKLDWDADVPAEINKEWRKWCRGFENLKYYAIPRKVINDSKIACELHIFSDSSKVAYGAVAYLRFIIDDNIHVKILTARNRVAPIKQNVSELSLPKLELTAALCASRLQNYIINNLNLNIVQVNMWTDSKIALYWITGEASKWKGFVYNRVTDIQNLTKNCIWRHCMGKLNPADVLTRGLYESEFSKRIDEWCNGPKFLTDKMEISDSNDNSDQIYDTIISSPVLCSLISTKHHHKMFESIFSLNKFETLEKCLRITAYIKRVFRKNKSSSLQLNVDELYEAEIYWLKLLQNEYFYDEKCDLKKFGKVNTTSSIFKLAPMLDKEGLIRMTTRLQESGLEYDTIFPIILPNKSEFVNKLIWKEHHRNFHSGINLTIAKLRKRYWIIRVRQRVKTVIAKCIICKKLRGKAGNEVFAPLPRDRMFQSRPFEIVGIDFAGPLFVKSETEQFKKSYIMLLTCAVTRAVHLEFLLNINTENCIKGIRRFISRRGVPTTIYSDNAKTFKRASLELDKLIEAMENKKFQEFLLTSRIKWKFIVERAAWWGGFWERMVRTVKESLKFALGKSKVDVEELRTVLTEVEAIINSRPLTYIGDDEELNILSPSSFLIGQTRSQLPIVENISNRNEILMKWKERQLILKKYWKKWSTDYLQQLRSANMSGGSQAKGSFKVGDVALLYEQNVPRLTWKLVKIKEVYPGRDGKIRSCTICLPNGIILKRSIQHLYPLEIPVTAAPEDVEN